MARINASTQLLGEVFSVGLYKRNQGRMVRQITWVVGVAVIVLGTYTLSQGPLATLASPVRNGIAWGLALSGAWLMFRLVNFPRFADFLISVEAEVDKVSWVSRSELYRSTIVVIGTMVFLGGILCLYDLIWNQILTLTQVLRI